MRVNFLTAAVLFFTFLTQSLLIAAEAELPKFYGKVGDTLTFKQVKDVMGNKQEMLLKITLTEMGKESATISVQPQIKNVPNLPPIMIPGIPLKVGFDPVGLIDNSYVELSEKRKVIDSGKERLNIGDQELECNWSEHEVVQGEGEGKVRTLVKYWICDQVPLTGLVKAEAVQQLPVVGDIKSSYKVVEFKKQ